MVFQIRSKICALLALVVAGACRDRPAEVEASAAPIRGGSATGMHSEVVSVRGTSGCSGAFIAKRCVLTASHCGAPTEVRLGQDSSSRNVWARVLRRRALPAAPGTDLMMMWTAPNATADDRDRDDEQFGNIDNDTHYTPRPAAGGTRARIGAFAMLIGYGPDGTNPYGTKRYGFGKVRAYSYPENNGSLTDHPDVYLMRGVGRRVKAAACPGDSGSPLIHLGQVYGVAYRGADQCNSDISAYTALHNGATQTWLREGLDDECAPKYRIRATLHDLDDQQQTRITGHIEGEDEGTVFPTCTINSPEADCMVENVRDGRRVRLTVSDIDTSKYEFHSWEEEREGACPCEDRESTTCEFDLEEGEYEQELNDHHCHARFDTLSRCEPGEISLPATSSAAYAAGGYLQLPPNVDLIAVEEHWAIRTFEPDPNIDAPQIQTAMVPESGADTNYCLLDINYREVPDFGEGGLEASIWIGDNPVANDDAFPGTELTVTEEDIVWQQTLSVAGGDLRFEISEGTSTTWPNFSLATQTAIGLTNLNTYRYEDSVSWSGIGYAANRVACMRMTGVRYYLSDGTTRSDTENRIIWDISMLGQ